MINNFTVRFLRLIELIKTVPIKQMKYVYYFLLCTSASSFRYNGLSVVYFLFLLVLPLLPNPSLVTMKGESGSKDKWHHIYDFTHFLFDPFFPKCIILQITELQSRKLLIQTSILNAGLEIHCSSPIFSHLCLQFNTVTFNLDHSIMYKKFLKRKMIFCLTVKVI